jgi:NAD(P)-dependent dehydrogenase (short-subunit alcohol dehydrogenase family)
VVVVTGCSSGFGRQVSEALARTVLGFLREQSD